MTGKRAFKLLEILFYGILIAFFVTTVNSARRRGEISSIHSSAMGGDTFARQHIRSYLSEGGDVEARTSDGRTLLMSAAWQARSEMVKLLIAHGADVNATDEDGRTALMHAADMDREFSVRGPSHLPVVQLLLAAGARPEIRDRFGHDARSLAEAQGKTAIVKLLQRAQTVP